MNLYDGIISETLALLAPYPFKTFPLGGAAWEEASRNEILLSSDTAYELGADGKSAALTVVTETDGLFDEGKILVYGEDLNRITTSAPFARVTLVKARGFEDDAVKCYNAVKDVEFCVYDAFPKDVMLRVSAFERRECLRVGKAALKNGVSFEKLGNVFASKYLNNATVESVTMIFVTADIPVYGKLRALAKRTDEITFTLNKVLSDMNFDCANCNLREICDQIEGLRELHFAKANK